MDDLRPVVHALLRANRQLAESNRQLADALEASLGPEPPPDFIPTDFQKDLVKSLKGRALRTDGIAVALDCVRSRIFADPGGIGELIDRGLVQHHKRLGYYRSDAPPPDLENTTK